MRLAELQERLTRSAIERPDPALAAELEGAGRLTALEALAVHHRGYAARLAEALGETFELCWRALGDEDFLAECERYARTTPSAAASVSDHGAGFPAFLARTRPFAGELARFEWELCRLFHAAAEEGLEPAALAAAARPERGLRLASSVRLLDFGGRVRVLLYKRGADVLFRPLSESEHAALAGLAAGLALERALAGAQSLTAEAAGALFELLAEERLIVGVGTAQPASPIPR